MPPSAASWPISSLVVPCTESGVAVVLDVRALSREQLGQPTRIGTAHADGGVAGGAAHEVLHRGVGDQPAAADHDQPLGRQRDLAHQVRGDEHRAALGGKLLQQVADPADALRVEAVGRLVQDQRGGIAQQRGGDAEPLAHAQREPADPLAGDGLEADQPDHLVDAIAADAMGLGLRQQVVVGAAAGVDRSRFEQRADLVQRRLEGAIGAAVDRRPAGRGPVEAQDQAHRRRLAGAVRAQEPGHDARLHREAEVIDSELVAVSLGQSLDLNHPLDGRDATASPKQSQGGSSGVSGYDRGRRLTARCCGSGGTRCPGRAGA